MHAIIIVGANNHLREDPAPGDDTALEDPALGDGTAPEDPALGDGTALDDMYLILKEYFERSTKHLCG
jgi:hypothetical protein